MLKDLVLRNRSYRRFHQHETVPMLVLESLVDLARQTASAGNRQPLKYILSNDPGTNDAIFGCLGWAGYLPQWPGPEEGERPAAYILVLGDHNIARDIDCDHGVAAQTILLGAVEQGFGGCMVGSINRRKLRMSLTLPNNLDNLLALALGRPKEKCILTPVESPSDIRYWRDENGVHYVPKRALEDIIVARYSSEP